MRRILVLVVAVLLGGCSSGSGTESESQQSYSDIKPDEHVVLFSTSAWLDDTGENWHVPVHGWIFEPEDSTFRKGVFVVALEEQFDLEVDESADRILSSRLNLLLADSERDKQIVIDIAGHRIELPPSSENGHFTTVLELSAKDVAAHSRNGRLPYSAVTRDFESRSFVGEVQLVAPTGVSVVSDIDDTVKISGVLDKKTLLEYTFLRDFEAAPGMSALYRDWSDGDVSFHFVSSSPWQLYEPLDDFVSQDGFPWATFSLKAVRFRDETLLDLFKKGTETKPLVIEEILNRYPQRNFVLVGDSGEQDPEVYAGLLRNYPEQILCVLIRNVSEELPDNERFSTVFAGIDPVLWTLFDDPATLTRSISPPKDGE